MKKLIIIFLLLIAGSSFAQIDTATWSIQRDGLGYYSVLTNRVTVGGVVAGGIRTPLIMSLNEIDTTNFQLIRDGLGYYSAAISKADMYGIDSGKIRVTISYSVGVSSPVTIDTNALRGYRVYAVLITQLDELAPEVTVIQNTFGLEPVWSYVNTGIFGCTFSGGFMGDTCVFVQDNYILYDNMNYGGNYWIYIEKSSSGFSLYTYAIDEGGGSMNGLLTNTFLEFRIY